MRTVKVGLIGLGTVGSGVVEILRKHGEDFRRRAGVESQPSGGRGTKSLTCPAASRPA